MTGVTGSCRANCHRSCTAERDADFDEAVAEQTAVDVAYGDLAREQTETDDVLPRYRDLGERIGRDGIAVRELLVHRVEE